MSAPHCARAIDEYVVISSVLHGLTGDLISGPHACTASALPRSGVFLDCALVTSQLTGGLTAAGQLQFLKFHSVAEKGLRPTYRGANVTWEPGVQRLQHGGVLHPPLYKHPFSCSVPETPRQANRLLIPHPAFTNKDEGTLTSLSCPCSLQGLLLVCH